MGSVRLEHLLLPINEEDSIMGRYSPLVQLAEVRVLLALRDTQDVSGQVTRASGSGSSSVVYWDWT